MSFHESVSYQIECDNCESLADEIDEDTTYLAERFETHEYGSIGREISGVWYEHICGNCLDNTFTCDWCTGSYWDKDGYFICHDAYFCADDCAEEWHSDFFSEDEIEDYFNGDTCEKCDWVDSNHKLTNKPDPILKAKILL